MRIAADQAIGKRIALFSAAMLALVVIGLVQLHKRRPAIPVANCLAVPSNVKTLGPPLSAAQIKELLAGPVRYSAQVRGLLEAGVTLREFRTGVTAGHLALRGQCYVGQAVAWVR